jgi:hypothetical protein
MSSLTDDQRASTGGIFSYCPARKPIHFLTTRERHISRLSWPEGTSGTAFPGPRLHIECSTRPIPWGPGMSKGEYVMASIPPETLFEQMTVNKGAGGHQVASWTDPVITGLGDFTVPHYTAASGEFRLLALVGDAQDKEAPIRVIWCSSLHGPATDQYAEISPRLLHSFTSGGITCFKDFQRDREPTKKATDRALYRLRPYAGESISPEELSDLLEEERSRAQRQIILLIDRLFEGVEACASIATYQRMDQMQLLVEKWVSEAAPGQDAALAAQVAQEFDNKWRPEKDLDDLLATFPSAPHLFSSSPPNQTAIKSGFKNFDRGAGLGIEVGDNGRVPSPMVRNTQPPTTDFFPRYIQHHDNIMAQPTPRTQLEQLLHLQQWQSGASASPPSRREDSPPEPPSLESSCTFGSLFST